MFHGRTSELALLKEKYTSSKSELVVIYGRRRIGKTTLIQNFLQNKKNIFCYEGIEGEHSSFQILNFSQKLLKKNPEKFTSPRDFLDWDTIFDYLTEKIIPKNLSEPKFILFFDEFQWMAAKRSRLTSIIKYYWDNYWKQQKVMLILCGSIASFMVKKVISAKALYGRISTEILLKGLSPTEAVPIFQKKRSREEILQYLLIFGGVPKYLEEINLNKSLNQNINNLCFSINSVMPQEVEKIFYAQFKESQIYLRIVKILKNATLSLQEIANKLKQKSGGSLREYLKNLENSEIIKSYFSFDKKINTKLKKYKLIDEYLIFYYQYVEPYLQIIREGAQKNLFELVTKDNFEVWSGFAFERFCLKNAFFLAQKMGFSEQVLLFAPLFSKEGKKFQIDLLYKRVDKVITICEIKYYNKKISAAIIKDFEYKKQLLQIPRGYAVEHALISLYGPDQAFKESGYLHHSLTLADLLNWID